MVCLRLPLRNIVPLVVVLICAALPVASKTYILTWQVPDDSQFYQTWAESILWEAGDIIEFQFLPEHNVWSFASQDDWSTCDFSSPPARELADMKRQSYRHVLKAGTSYFGSQIGAQCEAGMNFKVRAVPAATPGPVVNRILPVTPGRAPATVRGKAKYLKQSTGSVSEVSAPLVPVTKSAIKRRRPLGAESVPPRIRRTIYVLRARPK